MPSAQLIVASAVALLEAVCDHCQTADVAGCAPAASKISAATWRNFGILIFLPLGLAEPLHDGREITRHRQPGRLSYIDRRWRRILLLRLALHLAEGLRQLAEINAAASRRSTGRCRIWSGGTFGARSRCERCLLCSELGCLLLLHRW